VSLFLDREKSRQLNKSRNTNVSELISHGEMIYLLPSSASASSSASQNNRNELVVEDQIDQILAQQDGRIYRKADEQMCSHGDQGKCINCIPIEPFDLEYLSSREPPIKYVSFHAYLKSLKNGPDRGKYTNLEMLNCKIKPGCMDHPAWPKGICNKCQPSTIYLNRQPYRHTDNVMFENGQIVEDFLNYWRKSGHQRVGLLYGRYEAYDGVPLGLRAVVSAIYEPPQVDFII
jgi:nuclear protein localization protein 4 homolog